ncbi:hypothetical protein GCM10025869_30430 [Homoserinibacter gongjuensis]|uniref:Guanylate kinase-like domain-containing protein n=1 Tax=Homoserinibacter gongjuensis TaxID=1162968 RepID=A0ABQ6JZ79_9MICO|nr:hypothetical protein GCM10025869_30430 [Homoserinibacter gongjuensis]
MAQVSMPEVDRAAAGRAAIAARRARAAVKDAVHRRERRALEVAEAAWAEPASPEGTLRVRELLTSIPGIGPTRVARIMHELAIADAKRVGGLGSRQRTKLRAWLEQREGAVPPRSRLVVLAGPTAVGKGTVSSYIRDNYPEVLLSVSATTRPPRPGEVDGRHYYFVDDDTFDKMIAQGSSSSGLRCTTRRATAPRGRRSTRPWHPDAACCSRSICRGRARSRRRCPTRCSCSCCRPAGRSWCVV